MGEMKFWQKDEETMPVAEREVFQLERLQTTVNRAYRKVDFYRKKFDELNIKPDIIGDLSDISKLPFTTKQDLRDNYPYGMFAVPLRDIVRIHSSSGTTGKPTVVGYTASDLKQWNDLVARIMVAGGVSKEDIVHVSFTYGLFTGGFGLHYGAETIGASVIPVSSGNTARQLAIMEDYRSTVLVATPSYALHIAETMDKMGITKDKLNLKIALLGSEPWGDKVRDEIENRLGVQAFDNYGLSELMGPGISGECECKNGLHINEDFFYPEIIDPATLQPLPLGEKGELVLTTLKREGMPLIRYRTRDITRLYRDECACGRTLIKMEKAKGRTDDMLIVNGVNVFPSQVEEALSKVEGVSPHYMIFVRKRGALDEMEIKVEATEAIFFDEMKKQKKLLEDLTYQLAKILQFKPKVNLVMGQTLERFEGKAKRVVDERNI
ncbi:phenylacetate-CoA ligase [Seleniivibrio woodruffii]|uniref:Phenylacetate-coenzyme A ligase n=3 Tax=Seleniivibrio woodruffii TaxID=1078050 RepID=A0A4R1K7V6_9BACT|nr:phenylacetate-CoA ligase [Seleniivibrio woodruffii]TVZ36002.1 phenylacetate-CoA ligase [Seleniivibrio woodruffii]